MTAIRILLVDDVEQARRDLGTALNLFDDLEIIGEAGNGLEAIYLAQSLGPDVILMDLEMPVMDGYEVDTADQVAPPMQGHRADRARLRIGTRKSKTIRSGCLSRQRHAGHNNRSNHF